MKSIVLYGLMALTDASPLPELSKRARLGDFQRQLYQRDDDEFLELFRKQAALAPQSFWSRYLYDVSPTDTIGSGAMDVLYTVRLVVRWINELSAAQLPFQTRRLNTMSSTTLLLPVVSRTLSKTSSPTASMDKYTRNMLIALVKTLIFADHDTSASTLCVSPSQPLTLPRQGRREVLF
ncbi:hypothetical protein PENCOP_c006G06955 [Penicillium coprophilum]|uniref:Uncharacterized protein n=1 Tax=Penicillium coprophilum TaxID=36646 RepID=A0A1V6UNU6_9EURO|nr:hypothetical protein PENCOP_c006G06955 [Penicillium coprophilum]